MQRKWPVVIPSQDLSTLGIYGDVPKSGLSSDLNPETSKSYYKRAVPSLRDVDLPRAHIGMQSRSSRRNFYTLRFSVVTSVSADKVSFCIWNTKMMQTGSEAVTRLASHSIFLTSATSGRGWSLSAFRQKDRCTTSFKCHSHFTA
jgi:hypothetical protein